MGKMEWLLKLIDENLSLLDSKLREVPARKLVDEPFALTPFSIYYRFPLRR